jgi:hypothetical protein
VLLIVAFGFGLFHGLGFAGGLLEAMKGMPGVNLAVALVAGVGSDWPFETFPQYLDAIERRGSAINVGAMIGHTPVRLFVMGEEFCAGLGALVDRMGPPKGGALALGVSGGFGMLSAGMLGGPLIGFKQDYYASKHLKETLAVSTAEFVESKGADLVRF